MEVLKCGEHATYGYWPCSFNASFSGLKMTLAPITLTPLNIFLIIHRYGIGVIGFWSSHCDSNPFFPPISNAASGCGWRAIPAPLRVLFTSTPFPVVELIVFYLRKLKDLWQYKELGPSSSK